MKFKKTRVYQPDSTVGLPSGCFVVEYNGEPPLTRFFSDQNRPGLPTFIVFYADWTHWASYSQYEYNHGFLSNNSVDVAPDWNAIAQSPYGK